MREDSKFEACQLNYDKISYYNNLGISDLAVFL